MDGAAGIVGELLKLGLPGIVILGLFYAYVTDHRRLDQVQTERVQAAEKREERAVDALVKVTAAIDKLVDTLERYQSALEALPDKLRKAVRG